MLLSAFNQDSHSTVLPVYRILTIDVLVTWITAASYVKVLSFKISHFLIVFINL